MSVELHAHGADAVRVPIARHRRRAVVLLTIAVFQFWLWGTRIYNLFTGPQDFSAAFVAVHLALYATAIGAAIVLIILGVRLWQESRDVMTS